MTPIREYLNFSNFNKIYDYDSIDFNHLPFCRRWLFLRRNWSNEIRNIFHAFRSLETLASASLFEQCECP